MEEEGLDLSDGTIDPVMDDAQDEAQEIVEKVNNMTMEQYAAMRKGLLAAASRLHDLRGGTW